MLVYKIILSLFTLLGCLSIMKDLTDFVAVGKELGLSGDKLFKFAKDEYDSYLQSLEKERAEIAAEAERAERAKAAEAERAEQRAQAAYERELRLLDRRAQITDNERAVAEAAGPGGRVARSSPMSLHLDFLLLTRNLMILTHGFHCSKSNAMLSV